MLVTFKTPSNANITMFGTNAVMLLKLMGQSGKVPGAILPADIPAALEALQAGIAARPEEQASERADHDDDEPLAVSLATRAGPLIELLESARDADQSVLWEE